jgi:hypothetical protein
MYLDVITFFLLKLFSAKNDEISFFIEENRKDFNRKTMKIHLNLKIKKIRKYINKKRYLFYKMNSYDIKKFLLFTNSMFILFLILWTCIICVVNAR